MKLDSLAFDHPRLEGLDTEPVEGRRTVQKNRMSLHDVLQDVPDHRISPVDDLLGRLYGLDYASFEELADDERLVELRRHKLRKTALVHLQFRTYDDYGTRGIVHTFSEEVLTEAAGLSL